MAVLDILAKVDRDIALLQQARALLLDGIGPASKKKAGRPKKAVAAPTKNAASAKKAAGQKAAPAAKKKVAVAAKPAKKRKLTPEGRERIAEAVKRRWAAQKAKTGK
jgi:hypothetical protein